MGKLMIEGTVDLSQFWPIGESDADTTKIVLTILPAPFNTNQPETFPSLPRSLTEPASDRLDSSSRSLRMAGSS